MYPKPVLRDVQLMHWKCTDNQYWETVLRTARSTARKSIWLYHTFHTGRRFHSESTLQDIEIGQICPDLDV